MGKHVYIFSGLGADERVFQKMNLSAYDVTHIRWIEPGNNESIGSYALRISAQVKTEGPILIGLSFGGIMAIEVAKLISAEQVILIASVKTKNEMPFYYKWAGAIGLHKIIPAKLLRHSGYIANWLFGITTASDKKLLQTILKETGPTFLKWAINAIVHWNNKSITGNLKHIHGTADKIFPIKFVKYDVAIEGGGHFMTMDKPHQVMDAINSLIDPQ